MESEANNNACRKWQIILGEYVLGTVDERDRARLERHLARCERCRRELAETEKMYRLLGDFELAKPGPFFAAKVARAVRDEAEAAAAAPPLERALAGLGRAVRRPAVASAVAAASLAVVAAVLYVKVWLPRAPQELGIPTAGEVAPADGKRDAAPAREKEALLAEEKSGEGPRRALSRVDAPGEGVLPPASTYVAGELATEELAAVAGEPAEAPTRDEDEASAEGRPEVAARGTGAGAGAADEVALRRSEPAKAEEKAAKEKAAEETRYPATASPKTYETATAPFGARTRAAEGASGYAGSAGGSAFGRLADDAGTPGPAEREGEVLTAADVEVLMDARFEADIERLTGDGAALVDYVTPNGLLMTYFYELPVEEQKLLLSRLRRKAEAATAADLLLSH